MSIRSAGIGGTTTPAGTDQPLESRIMLTACSGNVSGDGLHNQPDTTVTQNEAVVDASVKRCGSSLVRNLDKKYSRRRKELRLPSPPMATSTTVFDQPSLDDTHHCTKAMVINELGIVGPDKGINSVIADPTRKKQHPRNGSDAPSISVAGLPQMRSTSVGVTSEVVPSNLTCSSADVDSSDTSCSKKIMLL